MTKYIAMTCLGLFLATVLIGNTAAAKAVPPILPKKDATVTIETQSWPWRDGPRTIDVFLHYPGGMLSNVNAETGLMLSLHNWGGTHWIGTANPEALANRYNVVAICLDYLQSGQDWNAGGAPYDCGYLQAIDALRALQFVFDGLRQARLSQSVRGPAPETAERQCAASYAARMSLATRPRSVTL